jgi:hypothetical protein
VPVACPTGQLPGVIHSSLRVIGNTRGLGSAAGRPAGAATTFAQWPAAQLLRHKLSFVEEKLRQVRIVGSLRVTLGGKAGDVPVARDHRPKSRPTLLLPPRPPHRAAAVCVRRLAPTEPAHLLGLAIDAQSTRSEATLTTGLSVCGRPARRDRSPTAPNRRTEAEQQPAAVSLQRDPGRGASNPARIRSRSLPGMGAPPRG